MRRALAAMVGGTLLLTGCGSAALDTSGPGARHISTLWWVMFALGTVVYVVVMALLALALRRARRARGSGSGSGSGHGEARGRRLIVGGGIVVPAVVLLGLTGATVAVGAALTGTDDAVVEVQVVGHQFWWEVNYPDSGVTTANEIHIPAGRPVELTVTSADVIHSFWVPELHGKIDMIPGRTNTLRLEADRAGTYRGQCAEFCAIAHAWMRVLVVAQEPADFDRWLAGQALPAAEPADDLAAEGRQIFLGSACVYCHTIDGTNATSRFGPDLTHLASRQTIAAGTLPNQPGFLAGWILDPQAHKPGNAMPATRLSGPELQALLAYLEGLE